jgi:hypothetical protein
MEPIEFVTAIRDRVIESDNVNYLNMLNAKEDIKDPLWKEVLTLYKSLHKEQQQSFLFIFRLIQVNTVSHILGILDGSAYLNDKQETFVLKTETSDLIINGDLQDIFLEMEEASFT